MKCMFGLAFDIFGSTWHENEHPCSRKWKNSRFYHEYFSTRGGAQQCQYMISDVTFFIKKKKKKQQHERLLIRINFGKCFNIILSILTGPLLSLPLTLFWDESKTAWNPHFFQNFSSTFHSHQASFSTIFTSIQLKSLSPPIHPLKSNIT